MPKPLCIIDRFEGEKVKWAVIEYDGKITFNLPRELLPQDASEGDVVEFDININAEETKSRRDAAEAMMRDLFQSE